jgi:hypothetical protein
MLAELLKQDHGQQVWSGEAARRHVAAKTSSRELMASGTTEDLRKRDVGESGVLGGVSVERNML